MYKQRIIDMVENLEDERFLMQLYTIIKKHMIKHSLPLPKGGEANE